MLCWQQCCQRELWLAKTRCSNTDISGSFCCRVANAHSTVAHVFSSNSTAPLLSQRERGTLVRRLLDVAGVGSPNSWHRSISLCTCLCPVRFQESLMRKLLVKWACDVQRLLVHKLIFAAKVACFSTLFCQAAPTGQSARAAVLAVSSASVVLWVPWVPMDRSGCSRQAFWAGLAQHPRPSTTRQAFCTRVLAYRTAP